MSNRELSKLYKESVAPMRVQKHERLLVREYKTKMDVRRAIEAESELFKTGEKRGSIRVAPKQKVEDREKLEKEFFDTIETLDLVIKDTIKPGEDGSPSGKFLAYRVLDKNSNEFIITLAGGAFSNKGMEYEREVFSEIKRYFDTDMEDEKPGFLEKLENALDVEFTGYDSTTSFETNPRRPLTPDGPTDQGKVIADMTLEDDSGNKYYISLKDVGGITVSNAGAKGLFDIDGNRIKFEGKGKGIVGKKLFEAAKVNIDKVEEGLNGYVTKTPTPGLRDSEDVTDKLDNNDLKIITNFIASAFDYGYIYVKRKSSKNDLEIIDFSEKQNLYDYIGDIEKVVIKYPYYINDSLKRKNIDIDVTTENTQLAFSIRNASGGIIPTQINLVKKGSVGEIKAKRASVAKIDAEDKNIQSALNDL